MKPAFSKTVRAIRSDERVRRVVLSAVTSAFSRGLAVLVPLIVVRVALEQLGSDTYGVWMATSSLFSLFAFADLGLGSGLQTRLARLYGLKDSSEARKAISSTAVVLAIVAGVIGCLYWFASSMIPWSTLLNAESAQTTVAVEAVVAAVVVTRIAMIPLGLVQRVQFAYQEAYASNLWTSASSVLSIVAVFTVVAVGLPPLWIVWTAAGMPVLVTSANFGYYFFLSHPQLRPSLRSFSGDEARALMRVGLGFMVLSVMTAIGLSMDSFIVARTSGVEHVAAYSIGFRIATVLGVATSMLSTPMWAANGEALAKHDYAWVRKTTQRISLVCLCTTTALSAAFLIVGDCLIDVWLGAQLEIPVLLLCGLLLMQILQSFVSPYFMVLNGAGVVRKQIRLFGLYTPISLVVKWVLASMYGPIAIPWSGAALYLVMIVLPVLILARKIYSQSRPAAYVME